MSAAGTIGGISVSWIDTVAELLRKGGIAFRAGDGPWIEVQNLSTGQFEALTLEKRARGDVSFASVEDRDAVLRVIEERVYPLIVIEG